MKKAWKKILLVIVLLLLPFIIFTYRLTENPPGFFIDESTYGYEAYHLLTNNGLSSSGDFLPRLFYVGPGDPTRNHHEYTYLVIPFIVLFGLTEFAVRLTSVIASILLLCILYLLLRKKVSFVSFCLAALCWPIIAWVFLLSRIGMEFMMTALFFALSLFFVERLHEKKFQKRFFLLMFLGISIGGLFYMYAAGKVLAVGMMALSLWTAKKIKLPLSQLFFLLSFFITTFLLAIPYVLDGSFFYRANELPLFCSEKVLSCFMTNLFSHLSMQAYFGSTYRPPDFAVYTHSIIGTSLIPWYLGIFLFIGIGIVIYRTIKKDFFSQLILFAALLAMIPASLTIRGFDSYRSVALLPLFFIFITYGIEGSLGHAKRFLSRLYLFVPITLCVLFMIFGYHELKILLAYEKQTVAATYGGWQYGYRQIFTYVQQHYGEYDRFVITPQIAYGPHIYTKFYDPKREYTKIVTGKISVTKSSTTLYILRPEEVMAPRLKEKFHIRQTIYYPNGKDKAFLLGTVE
ncbi:MAG: hypothetical protein AAB553_02760 [Patescibacteria group bacterium]